MTRIERLLRKEIGLDAASIGSSQIERTLRLRMKSLGLKRQEEYERLLSTSPAALEDLIEAVVVTETWFFRDREPFAAFAQMALQWLAKNPGGTLRALSVPCSSGEEPYSLAMALLDERVPPHRFVIDAVDISARMLARAKHAVYGRNSFRGKGQGFRERHFRHTKEGYALNTEVRECVRLQRDNLLGEQFLTGRAPYEMIFCRNLLIYFDRATQVRALEKLQRLLTPEGVLFVGPAELPLVGGNGFASANLPMAFACRKTVPPKAERGGRRTSALPPLPTPHPAPPQTPAHTNHSKLQSLNGSEAHAATFDFGLKVLDRLEMARQLADEGRLDEAAALCETHLRQEGPSAAVYYLLGLVSEAKIVESGKLRAEVSQPSALNDQLSEAARDYYRKALYLEPNHYEALLQMTLLLEKNGDRAGASTLRSRLRRVEASVPAKERAMSGRGAATEGRRKSERPNVVPNESKVDS